MALRPSRAARLLAGAVLAVVAGAALGCATPGPEVYTPEALRAELLRRVPDLPTEEAVVPFEVPAADAARARSLLQRGMDPQDGVALLIDALSDPEQFGLRYQWATTATAAETLERRVGNCFSLSSTVVGLARAAGVRAHYVEVRLEEARWRSDGDVAVLADHIAAQLVTRGQRLVVDFRGELGEAGDLRVIGDMEALAHYYNNRGYELIHLARSEDRPVPWAEVQRDFRVATRIQPGLARAWNNLGVASLRLGDLSGAEDAYLRAVEIEDLQSAHMNLAMLKLRRADVDGAIEHLRVAQRLDPRHPQLADLLTAAAEALLELEGAAGG